MILSVQNGILHISRCMIFGATVASSTLPVHVHTTELDYKLHTVCPVPPWHSAPTWHLRVNKGKDQQHCLFIKNTHLEKCTSPFFFFYIANI